MSKLAYQPGDTITVSTVATCNLQGAQTKCSVFIPVSKSLEFVSGATVRLSGTIYDYGFRFLTSPTRKYLAGSSLNTDIAATLMAGQVKFICDIANAGASDNYDNGFCYTGYCNITFN